jgi:hypothetical protein
MESDPVADGDPLVELLHQAAQLEHCLLDSYLYAACSLKTLPSEFAVLPDGRENRRRAIQFERVRAWKQAIMEVAREEMLHLHLVQSLIRALGAPPYFQLPPRDARTGNWVFGNWTAHAGSNPPEQGGTQVPVDRVTPANVKRFVLYESTDALQDDDPFGPHAMALFEQLRGLELDYLLESVLYDVEDKTQRDQLKSKLTDLYENLPPAEAPRRLMALLAVNVVETAAADVTFQSIADLYKKQILPLYQEAFKSCRVGNNLAQVGELADKNYAAEGFLPVQPVYRDKNFQLRDDANTGEPLYNVKRLEDIIDEIVEEGEGLQKFVEGAKTLLDKVDEIGTRKYIAELRADQAAYDSKTNRQTPAWLDECQRIRTSHLYRFAVTMMDLKHEIELANEAGTTFDPSRTPQPSGVHPEIDALTTSLPAQFNSAYLCLVMWLGRMYELKTWEDDRRRRMGIEMLAAWPMMSIAIRPFVELAGFLSVDPRTLFELSEQALPADPPDARELFALWTATERSQEINDQMDQLALKTLTSVATWAGQQEAAIAAVTGVEPEIIRAMTLRLSSLATLDEFEKQFPYREHGGYSNRLPDKAFLFTHPDGEKYEEDGAQNELFDKTFVLRVRFSGRSLVQLSTDPDPPTDEAGCSGTCSMRPTATGTGSIARSCGSRI